MDHPQVLSVYKSFPKRSDNREVWTPAYVFTKLDGAASSPMSFLSWCTIISDSHSQTHNYVPAKVMSLIPHSRKLQRKGKAGITLHWGLRCINDPLSCASCPLHPSKLNCKSRTNIQSLSDAKIMKDGGLKEIKQIFKQYWVLVSPCRIVLKCSASSSHWQSINKLWPISQQLAI